MEVFQVWVLPERKVSGSHDKWQALEPVEASSRKSLVEQYKDSHKSGTWKIRKV